MSPTASYCQVQITLDSSLCTWSSHNCIHTETSVAASNMAKCVLAQLLCARVEKGNFGYMNLPQYSSRLCVCMRVYAPSFYSVTSTQQAINNTELSYSKQTLELLMLLLYSNTYL